VEESKEKCRDSNRIEERKMLYRLQKGMRRIHLFQFVRDYAGVGRRDCVKGRGIFPRSEEIEGVASFS